MQIFKLRVRKDKDNDPAEYRRRVDSRSSVECFQTPPMAPPCGLGYSSGSTTSLKTVVSLGGGDQEDLSGATNVEEESEGTDSADVDVDHAGATVSERQQALTQLIVMHNLVYGTDESLTSTADGNSTCDTCGTNVAWTCKEGARVAGKHLFSKKHADARKCLKKEVITERQHTTSDMHRVLGQAILQDKKGRVFTPRANEEGHLVGLVCGNCALHLAGTTVYMAIGNSRKHMCTRKRRTQARGTLAAVPAPKEAMPRRGKKANTTAAAACDQGSDDSSTPTHHRRVVKQTTINFQCDGMSTPAASSASSSSSSTPALSSNSSPVMSKDTSSSSGSSSTSRSSSSNRSAPAASSSPNTARESSSTSSSKTPSSASRPMSSHGKSDVQY